MQNRRIGQEFSEKVTTNYSSNFGGRVVEFHERLKTVAHVKKKKMDAGDIFRALDRYVVLCASYESFKGLLKTDNLENNPSFRSIKEQYEEVAYNQSGLRQILSNLEFYDVDLQDQSDDYSLVANKIQRLLAIYVVAMNSNFGYQSNADKEEMKTAFTLASSSTPIPGAPIKWYDFIRNILLVIFCLIITIEANRSDDNRT